MDSFPLPPLSTATHTAHDNPAFPTIGVVEGWQASKWGTDVYVAMSAFFFEDQSPLRFLRKFWPSMFVAWGNNPFLIFYPCALTPSQRPPWARIKNPPDTTGWNREAGPTAARWDSPVGDPPDPAAR